MPGSKVKSANNHTQINYTELLKSGYISGLCNMAIFLNDRAYVLEHQQNLKSLVSGKNQLHEVQISLYTCAPQTI